MYTLGLDLYLINNLRYWNQILTSIRIKPQIIHKNIEIFPSKEVLSCKRCWNSKSSSFDIKLYHDSFESFSEYATNYDYIFGFVLD